MEWQISPLARTSALNEQPFKPGDTVVTLLLMETGEGIRRFDIHAADEDAARRNLPGSIIGRWKRVLKPPSNDREEREQRLQSAEDLFLSLYEESALPAQTEEPVNGAGTAIEVREALKHFLALHLERKKVLRAQGRRRREGLQTYIHVKTKRELVVPVLPFDQSLVRNLLPAIEEITL